MGEGRWRVGGVGVIGVVGVDAGVGIGGVGGVAIVGVVVVDGVGTGIGGVNRGPTTEMCKGVADGCADSTTPVSGHPNNHVDEGVDIWGCVGDGLKGVVWRRTGMKRWWKVFVRIGGTVGTLGEQQHK